MKISVIVPGRLHGFDMALYFQKVGVLNELVTGYPTKYVSPFGIEKRYVKSLYVNEIINRITNWLGLGYPLDYLACESFDYLASKFIKFDSDIYFIWSGYGLKTIEKIRSKNQTAKIILVRGSAHIEEQERLLQKVNANNKQYINPKIIKKELKEYEAVDYITLPSSFAYKSFVKKGFRVKKLFLNFLGVELNQFPFKRKKTGDDKLIIGNVGTLSKQKNVEAIIKVILSINQLDKFQLVLAGPVEHQSFSTKLLDFPFVDYKGKIPQKDLYKIYQKIDLFIINSVQEGMAMVQIQAMSCGCPIISTVNSGGSDFITNYENGITIPIMNELALKDAILWFYENKNRIPEMGSKSREIVEKGFTWDDFGKRNIDFINQILKY